MISALRIGRARRAVLSLLAVVALGIPTLGMSLPEPAPGKPHHQVTRIDTANLTSARTPTETSSLSIDPREHCEPTLAGSRERKAGATEGRVITRVTPVKATNGSPLPKTGRGPLSSLADEGSCEITNPGNYSYGRFQYCMTGVNVLYILRDGNGKTIGTGTLEVSTSATLPRNGTKWDERVTVKMTGATDAVTTLSAKFRSDCTQSCIPTKTAPWYGGSLTEGQSLSGTVSFSSTPGPDSQVDFTTSYKLYVAAPGAQIIDPNAAWSNPRKIRCDDAVRDVAGDPTGTPSPGCVIPTVTAVVPMSAQGSDPGGAVAAYLWAQHELADHWGRDKLLTRAKSGAADRKSRTCGSASSKPFADVTDIIPTDTCAQFPFAETTEGGTDGAGCAEVIPDRGNDGWIMSNLGGGSGLDSSKPCVRAHVALADKQFADGQLSEGFENQRVLNAEQFKLELTASLDGSYAACLGGSPDEARRSGNGWIWNTTEWVAHINKTTNPQGEPGYRAARAQACIGKTPGKGSDADGDITGWQDAQLFAAANSPGTGIDRCHLIANVLGGRISNNLVPCWHFGMNTGTPSMRTYETQTQIAVANLGDDDAILYQVTPKYVDATSTIPVGVTMSATIEREDGSVEELFPDVYIPNTQANTGLFNLGN